MKRMDRRKFMLVASVGSTSAILVACGNDPDDVDLTPTMIPVEGAPPTLAPYATPGGGAVAEEEGDAGDTAGGGASNAVTLEAQDPFNWSTNELEAAPGQVIQITNTGAMEHDFVIDELEIHEVLPNGEPVEVTLPEDLTVGDTYTYYCSVPGHRESGMEGTLTIVEASAEAPAEEEGEEAPAGGDGGGDASGPVTLEAQDPFNWSTNELEASPGQVIQVTNAGVMEHDFVIDELGISEVLPNGEPVEVTLPDDLAVGDTYTYYCSVPGHRESGMEGTLSIVEAGAAAAPVAATPAATPAGGEAGGGDAAGVELATVDIAFEPNEFSIAAGTDVEVTITNNGVLEHDFHIEELGVASELLASGESATVTINGEAGSYEFFCSVPGHREAGMVGTLTIE
jgi:plastocyanin